MSEPTRTPAPRVPATPYRRPAAPGPDALRLDGNEGSRPPTRLLAELAAAGPSLLRDYPCLDELQEDLARRLGVPAEWVVVTAGADDALDRALRSYLAPGRELLLPVPTFEMLYRFGRLAGAETVTVPWRERFPVAELEARVGARTGLVAVVSPNNPTGRVAAAGDLARLAAAAPGALVVLDHVYVEYADEDLTIAALEHPNVAVVRTLSKAWGLAGCRVGYAVARPQVAAALRAAGNPYPVAAPSIRLARARLADGGAELAAHVGRVRAERDDLARRLAGWGVPTPPSQGNFLFPDFGDRAEEVRLALAARGVVVRRFAHRREIAGGLRVTLPGAERDYRRLVAALEEVAS